MLLLDHPTVIAPTLAEGVAHVRACPDLDRRPALRAGPEIRYRALIDTPAGRRTLT